MRDINNTFQSEKNKQENRPINLYTLVDYDGASNDLTYAGYDTDITFDGVTYSKFPITHENIKENTRGEVDKIRVIVGNVSRLIQAYLEDYDFTGKQIKIKTVWANQLGDTDAYIEEIYYIDSYTADQKNVSFLLSSKFDITDLELPARKFSRNYCQWKFKSDQCGYSGAETECNKTLTRCRELSNETRFGGFPSVPAKTIIIQ